MTFVPREQSKIFQNAPTGWAFRDAQRELVETCDRKIAALERLKQITEDCDLWTALDDPKVQEQIKDYLREQGLWPPKKQ